MKPKKKPKKKAREWWGYYWPEQKKAVPHLFLTKREVLRAIKDAGWLASFMGKPRIAKLKEVLK